MLSHNNLLIFLVLFHDMADLVLVHVILWNFFYDICVYLKTFFLNASNKLFFCLHFFSDRSNIAINNFVKFLLWRFTRSG